MLQSICWQRRHTPPAAGREDGCRYRCEYRSQYGCRYRCEDGCQYGYGAVSAMATRQM
ncbi:hypothetical protein [Arthrobacter sp. UYEF20]|uniref:hypothetical protein n=1 Tax=Arthrobacter sp. UYEF20 TaxID=1756363 RepID=UPI003399EE78